jgi:hypothetical protein
MSGNPEGREQKCDDCERDDTCAEHRGAWLCYACWWRAREKETPYHVVSRSQPGRFSRAMGAPSCGLYEEAVARAAEMNADDEKSNAFWKAYAEEPVHVAMIEAGTWQPPTQHPCDFEPVAATVWGGDRCPTHPGYRARRRRELLAAHPEYARKDDL